MTLVKVLPKFKCNIYSDIDFQSAISVSSTGNSRPFTVLTDQLAFVNLSSPAGDILSVLPDEVVTMRDNNKRLQ